MKLIVLELFESGCNYRNRAAEVREVYVKDGSEVQAFTLSKGPKHVAEFRVHLRKY